MGDKSRGLYGKFHIERTDGKSAPGEKHNGCDYFVLDLTCDPHAAPALRAYADSCEADYPQLAADLRAKLGPPNPARKEIPMSKDEAAIEAEIKEKGLTAKRITPDMLDAEIVAEDYHVFPGSCLTVCCLTLKNGFTVTGESACASPENFNAEIGQKIARSNAREKLWPLLGFRLRDQLAA